VRVALIGGTGFIGHHVSRWLVEADTDVTVIHRGQTRGQVPGLRSLIADRKDTPALTAALATTNPDVVVDMTAYTGEDVERLLSALPASLARLVLVSSGDVYWTYGSFLGLDRANATAVPPDEQSPLREQLYPYRAKASGPEDLLYSYDKIVVERIARDGCRVPVTVLRLPMVYGPGDRQNRVGGYLERLTASGGALLLNSAEAAWRTRGYVEDVAWAIQLAALDDRAVGEVFNLGEADALTQLEWVRAIAGAAEWPGTVLVESSEPATLPANWQMPLIADSSRIRRTLGFHERVGREEGLRRTVADQRES
jgi:nucleoside-diphosphate-sugar epimerase